MITIGILEEDSMLLNHEEMMHGDDLLAITAQKNNNNSKTIVVCNSGINGCAFRESSGTNSPVSTAHRKSVYFFSFWRFYSK